MSLCPMCVGSHPLSGAVQCSMVRCEPQLAFCAPLQSAVQISFAKVHPNPTIANIRCNRNTL